MNQPLPPPTTSTPGRRPHGLWLAIESTQGTVSVALGRWEPPTLDILAERAVDPTRDADVLLPAIDAMVRGCGCAPSQLVGVVVGLGPGGFTGARIGVSTGQAIAESLRVSIAGIPSALGIAQATCGGAWSQHDQADVIVLLATRGNACWATHVSKPRGGAPDVASQGIAQSTSGWAAGAMVVGDEHLPGWATESAGGQWGGLVRPVVGAAALLTLASFGDGPWNDDPARIAPMYAHAPSTTPRPG